MNPLVDRARAGYGSLALVMALALASVVPAPYAILWPDTVRDVSISLAFARGDSVPLAGPPVNFGPHLGPAWIWLQAIPLALAPSLVAASVFVAAVAALKFPLLYFLGRALSGERLGVCFAAAAAFPSIAAYQWMVFFHPNWVEAAVAAVLLLSALAMKRASMGFAHGAAAALGFAIQMHPTSLFYAPFVALAFVATGLRGPRLAMHGVGGCLLVVAWFAPLLLAGELGQREGLEGVSLRVGSALAAFSPREVLGVLRTAYVEVPVAVGATHAAVLGAPGWLWNLALLVVGTGAAAGLAASLIDRNRLGGYLAALALLLIAGWIVASAIRSYTSFYLCYFLLPLSAVVMGASLERLASSRAAVLRAWGWSAIALAVLCFLTAAAGARAVGRSGQMHSRLPTLGDLKHPGPLVRAGLATAAARDAAARYLCASPMPKAVLHGELGYAFAASTGLDMRLHCPTRKGELRILGPTQGALAVTAIPLADAMAIGRTPAARLRGLAAFDVKDAVHPAVGRVIENDWYYFERLRDRVALTPTVLEFTTASGSHVMVYRLKPFDSRWQNFRVMRDSVPTAPSLSTYNSDVYASGASSASRWRIEFETDAPQWVDVHVF